MTGMPWSAAACSWLLSAVPSIAATMSRSAPCVIIWSTCWDWVGMSSPAYCRSTSYPFSSSCSFTELPSAIHRSDVSVGIATPILRSSGSALLLDEPLPAPSPPHAARASAMTAVAAVKPSFLLTCDLLFETSAATRPGAGPRDASPVNVSANNDRRQPQPAQWVSRSRNAHDTCPWPSPRVGGPTRRITAHSPLNAACDVLAQRDLPGDEARA